MLQQQLTTKGIELLQTIPEHKPHILFRNNHFYVLLRHENVWTLLSDQGFQESNFVWESLSIDGDSLFVNYRFDFVDEPPTPLNQIPELIQDEYPGNLHFEADPLPAQTPSSQPSSSRPSSSSTRKKDMYRKFNYRCIVQ
jgi:hypothetical protein